MFNKNRMMLRAGNNSNLIILLCAFYSISFGQESDFFLGKDKYPFIKYDSNYIQYMNGSNPLNELFLTMDSIMLRGNGNISIVHIGGSHIQADIYTHVMRKRLQTMQHGMNAGRGFIFPARMARTNNPTSFYVTYSGSWNYCKSTSSKKVCTLGLSGMQVSTNDTKASITIMPNVDSTVLYNFNKIKVYHNKCDYTVAVKNGIKFYSGTYDTLKGATIINLPHYFNKVTLSVQKDSADSEAFELYGLNLDTDVSGIVYHSIGVNGSMLKHYLKCNLYEKHLASLNPDLVIFSIGTNDGYTRNFKKETFKKNYSELINRTFSAAPKAKIMLTVPNDSYLYKRYPNKNTALMRDVLYSLAKQYDTSIWDFYKVMGGFNSSQSWYLSGLMKYDRIHFNWAGYALKGDLFYSAFLKSWENHLKESSQTNVISTK